MLSGKMSVLLTLFGCLVARCAAQTAPEPPVDVRAKAVGYLKTYGYLKEGNEHDQVSLQDAIKALQSFAGIQQTGVLDDATLDMINTPRCSLPDMDASEGKAKRFFIVSKWPKTELDYRIFNYPTNVLNLVPADVDRIIARAWKVWSDTATKLSFPVSTSDTPTQSIRFLKLNHTDKYKFDGPGGTLAHAFYPTNGNIHFDDDETWSDGVSEGKNMAWVATHEFGHSLGLGHSNVTSAFMFPFYTGYKPIITLDADDIAGILSIYPN